MIALACLVAWFAIGALVGWFAGRLLDAGPAPACSQNCRQGQDCNCTSVTVHERLSQEG